MEKVADRLRDVIFRKKNICQQLTREYGLVKEQLLLMQDGNLTQPEYITAKENAEKLSQVIESLSKLTEQEQEQDAFLMWENIKHLRGEQLRITDKILERCLNAKIEEQPEEPSEEQDCDEKKIERVAWKK